LHGNEGLAFVIANLINRADIQVVKSRCGTRLALEALQRLAISRKLFGKELERNMSAELQVFGFVNYAHASATQFAQDLVMRDGAAEHGRTSWMRMLSG